MFPRFTRKNAIKPMSWQPSAQIPFVRFTKRLLPCLLIALLLLVLAGCSKAVSVTPMPRPPANLAANCPLLPSPPALLTDPDRAVWEADIIAKYADCSVKHRLTVEAWIKALEAH